MNGLPEPAYSGPRSKKFWEVIGNLPSPQRDTAYSLGVALQNCENEIRRLIIIEIVDASEKQEPKPRKADTHKPSSFGIALRVLREKQKEKSKPLTKKEAQRAIESTTGLRFARGTTFDDVLGTLEQYGCVAVTRNKVEVIERNNRE